MILALLLQTVVPQGPPYAVYATLVVGVLSLIASSLNIYFSSKTAQNVVNLSTKTTKEVAELSAQVSRESAILNAQTTRDIKDSDYKNDYYKKIIDKRIKAIEGLETMLSSFIALTKIVETDERFHSFFKEEDTDIRFRDAINKIVSYNIWYSYDTGVRLRRFATAVTGIIELSRNLNEAEKEAFFIKEHSDFEEIVIELQQSMALDMYKLHDVDSFFKSKLRLMDNA